MIRSSLVLTILAFSPGRGRNSSFGSTLWLVFSPDAVDSCELCSHCRRCLDASYAAMSSAVSVIAVGARLSILDEFLVSAAVRARRGGGLVENHVLRCDGRCCCKEALGRVLKYLDAWGRMGVGRRSLCQESIFIAIIFLSFIHSFRTSKRLHRSTLLARHFVYNDPRTMLFRSID